MKNDVADAWQLPQGGINPGEGLRRQCLELDEEIGTNEIEIIGKLNDSIKYEWPEEFYFKGYRGQEQFYYLVRLKPSATINLNNHHTVEFSKVAWLSSEDFFSKIKGFKKDAYLLAINLLKTKYPNTII